jgi:lipoate-protein ligase A
MKALSGYSGDDFVNESVYKAEGGIVRVSLDAGDVIKKIKITGDFFIFPEDSIEELEEALAGTSTDNAALLKVIKDFYENIDSYGVEPEDLVKAIMKAYR